MAFPTKVQLIQRKASEQFYLNFPSARWGRPMGSKTSVPSLRNQ
jgi:hypothetical protein